MKTVALGDVVHFKNGGTPSKANGAFWDGLIPWVSSADFGDLGRLTIRRYVTDDAISKSATNVADTGDVLLVIRTGVGKTSVVRSPVAFSQDITALSPAAGLDARYLWHFLQAKASFLVQQARGATIQGVTRRVVSDLRMPLPLLDEQRRVAVRLDRMNALSEQSSQAEALCSSMVEAQFMASFGDAPANHQVMSVAARRKGSVRTGPFGSQLLHSEFTSDGVAVLGIDNVVTNQFAWRQRRYISAEKYRELERYTVQPGDVLITIMGTCGRCVVVPDEMPLSINTKHLCAITVDRALILPEFLRACFLWHPESRRHLSSQTKGAVMDGLNMGIIKSMPIPLPSLDQQHNFVNLANAAQAHVGMLRERSQSLDIMQAALRQRAFPGQL